MWQRLGHNDTAILSLQGMFFLLPRNHMERIIRASLISTSHWQMAAPYILSYCLLFSQAFICSVINFLLPSAPSYFGFWQRQPIQLDALSDGFLFFLLQFVVHRHIQTWYAWDVMEPEPEIKGCWPWLMGFKRRRVEAGSSLPSITQLLILVINVGFIFLCYFGRCFYTYLARRDSFNQSNVTARRN